MDKYVRLDWPECQKFMDHPECYTARRNDSKNFGEDYFVVFVPERIYSLSKEKAF